MTSIYLAGKISKDDWRHDIVSGLRGAWPDDCYSWAPTETWPTLKNAALGTFDYLGPHFVSDDHGCGHGPSTHGCGRDGEVCALPDVAPNRSQVRDLCLEAIDTADIVFAWLNDVTAYGTLVELGYAKGRGKRIIIAAPRPLDDLWFAASCATFAITAKTPREALELIAENMFPDFDSPIEEAFWKACFELAPKELHGLKPQHPVFDGRYRVDFALPDKKIGIELDGYAWHSDRETFTKDRARQRELEADGWRLIRFSGAEINADPGGCVRQAAALAGRFERGERG